MLPITPFFKHISRAAGRVVEIDKEGSRLRGRVQGGTGSRCFPAANVVLVLQFPSGAVQFGAIGAETGDSG
jgi:hypothetical protein